MPVKTFALLCAALVGCLSAGGAAEVKQSSAGLAIRGSVEMAYNPIVGNPVSVWSGGAFISVDHARSEAPIFRVFDENGRQLSEIKLTIPGARLINVYAGRFARGLDGWLAVAGSAYSDDSRGGLFLALLSPDGRDRSLIRLNPFAPLALTVAGDGSIWMAGQEVVDGKEGPPSHHVVRRFDRTGKMTASFVPRAELPDGLHPADGSFLVAARDRVGWYSQRAKTYFEFTADGTPTARVRADLLAQRASFSGIALCEDGELYVGQHEGRATSGVKNWGIYRLVRGGDQWDFHPQSGRPAWVLGCQGTSVAVTADMRTITWLGR